LRIFCLASVLEIQPFSKCFPDRARGHIPPHATPRLLHPCVFTLVKTYYHCITICSLVPFVLFFDQGYDVFNSQQRMSQSLIYLGYPQIAKTSKAKNTTQYVLNTTMHKQTQITWIRHEPFYHQLGVKRTNRTSFLCGNRNGHHNTELKT
jgi:hypothetical protein